jgi:DNA-3-methyladenine glycosylase
VKITREFFRRDPLTCARGLIGCEMVWGGVGGVIVETEAYSVLNDEACHTFSRPSSREFVAEKPTGTAYVYLNYGMHWLLNFLVKGGTEDGFVLIRALEPTRALGMNGDFHGRDFFSSHGPTLIAPSKPPEVLDGPRIGIARAKELPWRFVLADSRYLSVPMKAR